MHGIFHWYLRAALEMGSATLLHEEYFRYPINQVAEPELRDTLVTNI